PERMKEEVRTAGYTFPYLFDETQEVAKAYRAACTPDFFLFDRNRKLVYRGQFDDSRPGNGVPVTGRDLRAALDAVLEGRPVPTDQKPSMGCNIKWKPGNEPDYYK
ncbi:MAG: thioredoxin family protein, partial [Limisphaera sp.]